jgi:hypothetical protein
MTFVPAMWSVWIALLFLFIGIKRYVSRLSRDEDDELFLGESVEHLRIEQAALPPNCTGLNPSST